MSVSKMEVRLNPVSADTSPLSMCALLLSVCGPRGSLPLLSILLLLVLLFSRLGNAVEVKFLLEVTKVGFLCCVGEEEDDG